MSENSEKNNLSISHPSVAAEWNYEKNGDLKPEDVTHAVRRKVWWICSIGHEWQAYVYSRTGSSKAGCPTCAIARRTGRRPPYEKSLAHLNPELAKEWNYERNDSDRGPDGYSPGSNAKVWWKCSKNPEHEWETGIAHRKKSGCPYCAGQKVSKEKSFGAVNPHLVKQWHPTKNDKSPFEVAPHTHKKAWFICEEGHEWEALIQNRTKGKGCPFCSGHKATDETSLLGTYPDVCKEWDYKKNKKKDPNKLKPQSNDKVWWKCSRGHEYKMRVYSRTSGRGCPTCSGRSKTSFPEQAILYYVSQAYPEVENRKKLSFLENNAEADIYIQSLNLAIEYDGYHHRSSKERDERKNKAMNDNGVKLLRVREYVDREYLPHIEAYGASFITHRYDEKNGLDQSIKEVLSFLLALSPEPLAEIDVDTHRDRGDILKQIEDSETNLANFFPHLAEEWHPTKNGSLQPNQVSPFTHAKVWWRCSKNHEHEWESKISNRSNGRSCPYCLNRKINHTNSLAALAPETASQWHPTKNGDLTPHDVALNYGKRVWWQCTENPSHEWRSNPNSRVKQKRATCPYCTGRYVTRETSLGALNEEVSKEWDYAKNGDLTPFDVRPNSNKKVWWKCKKGHEWKTGITNRTRGSGCPTCAGNIVKSESSLAALNPKLVKEEWDYKKNEGLVHPIDVSPNSKRKAWWICPNCKGSYQRMVRSQVNRRREKCNDC